MKLLYSQINRLNVFVCFTALFTLLFSLNSNAQTTYSTPGADTYVVPGGVTCITVQIWGAGGAGGSRTENEDGAGGGGGGGYTFAIVPVTPGQVIDLYVGAGGQPVTGNNDGGNGETSWFLGASAYLATGGAGGTWGALTVNGVGGAGGTGTFSGGTGGSGRNNGSGTGGGGGGAAGTTANGGNGVAGAAGAGAGGTSPLADPQGNGGNGGAANGNGVAGQSPGGGGGGSGSDESAGDRLGGAGGNGQIIVTTNALNICASYCSNAIVGNTYPISNVTFNTINNTTSDLLNATPGVQDFTGICTSVTQGLTYNLSVTATGAAGNPFNISAYFDWNLDGDFNDAGEAVVILAPYTTATGTATVPITIPCDAIAGRSIQMRIINRFSTIDPCANSTNGQIENYCITIVGATAPISDAGPDQNIPCVSSATLNASASVPAAGFWTLISGTGTITTPTSPTSTVTGMTNGANVFQWTSIGICETDVSTVTINVSGLPDVPVSAGNDIFTCTQGLALNGSAPAPYTGQWVVISGPNVPVFTPGLTSNDAQVSGMINGTYVLEWRVNTISCGVLSDQMIFNFGSLPAPNAGSDQTICPTGAVLNANDFDGAIGTWSVFSGPAGSGFVDVNDPNTLIYGLVAGSYVLRWTISGGGCAGTTFDAMTITVNPCTIAVTHGATTDQTFTGCSYTYADNGGPGGSTTQNAPGNYSNNISQTWTTFCPDDPNAFATLTFNTAGLFPGDFVVVYDEPGVGSPIVAALFYDVSNPGGPVNSPSLGTTITSSTGCLYVQMNTTATNNYPGFTATVGCSPIVGVQNQNFVTPNNCGGAGGITICTSGGQLAVSNTNTNPPDLGNLNSGCLGSQEGASNTWAYITAETTGWIAFEIAPAGGQDFDYGIWGPYDGGFACPGVSLDQPLRCSWSLNGGSSCDASIGLGILNTDNNPVLPVDVSEGGFCAPTVNEGWTYPIYANAGEVYVLLFQNYSFNNASFTFNINDDASLIPPGEDYAILGCTPPTPLPVELISFVGEHKNRQNHLYWNTASEFNNDFFTIEKSADGKNWSVLSTITGAGFSTDFKHYSAVDENPLVGINYYRLLQTDYNGQKRSYKTIALNTEVEIIEQFSNLYPNPTSDYFHFNYGGTDFSNTIYLEMYDQTGKLVKQLEFNKFNDSQNMEVETDDIETGMYQVILTQKDHQERRKISIIR